MAFVDNRNTMPQNNSEFMHRYRMNNDPLYKNTYNLQQNDRPLEDTSLDMIPLGLSAMNGIGSTLKGLGNIASNAINVPINEARRQGLKDIGKVGLGMTAIGGATAHEIAPSLGSILMESAAPKISLKSLNDSYSALNQVRSLVPYGTGKIPETNLLKIFEASKHFGKNSDDIMKLSVRYNKADDDMLKMINNGSKNTDDFLYDVRDMYRDAPNNRISDFPPVERIRYELKNNPEFKNKYGHLGSAEEVEKVFKKVRDLDTGKHDIKDNMYELIEKSTDDTYKMKEKLRNTKEPVLSKDELESEIARQNKKLDAEMKINTDLKKRADDIINNENYIDIGDGLYLDKEMNDIFIKYNDIERNMKYDKAGNPDLSGLSDADIRLYYAGQTDQLPSIYDSAVDVGRMISEHDNFMKNLSNNKYKKRIDAMTEQLNKTK